MSYCKNEFFKRNNLGIQTNFFYNIYRLALVVIKFLRLFTLRISSAHIFPEFYQFSKVILLSLKTSSSIFVNFFLNASHFHLIIHRKIIVDKISALIKNKVLAILFYVCSSDTIVKLQDAIFTSSGFPHTANSW